MCPAICRTSGHDSLPFAVAPLLDFPGALGRVKGSLAPLATPATWAVAPLTRPARSRVVGNYRSDGEVGGSICFPSVRTSVSYTPITVLCLDESQPKASRSFHDVLLPRLVLACTADDPASGRAWSICSASHIDGAFTRRRTCRSSSRDEGRTSCLRLNVSFGITDDRPTARSVRRTHAWPRMRSPQRHFASCCTALGVEPGGCWTRRSSMAIILVSKRSSICRDSGGHMSGR